MKKYLIINEGTVYLKTFFNYQEANNWAIKKCDLSKNFIVQEYNEIIEFHKCTVFLN
jgi:hypothetical protein